MKLWKVCVFTQGGVRNFPRPASVRRQVHRPNESQAFHVDLTQRLLAAADCVGVSKFMSQLLDRGDEKIGDRRELAVYRFRVNGGVHDLFRRVLDHLNGLGGLIVDAGPAENPQLVQMRHIGQFHGDLIGVDDLPMFLTAQNSAVHSKV